MPKTGRKQERLSNKIKLTNKLFLNLDIILFYYLLLLVRYFNEDRQHLNNDNYNEQKKTDKKRIRVRVRVKMGKMWIKMEMKIYQIY